MTKNVFYCNVDFDIRLAGIHVEDYHRIVSESTYYYLFLGNSSDKIILDIDLDDEYLDYINTLLGPLPQRVLNQEKLSGFNAVPAGWNDEAISRFQCHDIACYYPELTSIAKVNSKVFSWTIGKKHLLGNPVSTICHTAEELFDFVQKCENFPLVLKPASGNAGIGFRFIQSPEMSNRVKKYARRYFRSGSEPLIAEEWYKRKSDFSSYLYLDKNGEILRSSTHRTFNDHRGSFYGILLSTSQTWLKPFTAVMKETIVTVASELHTAGYWGPFGIDSLTINNPVETLIPLVEINAREPISRIAYSLQKRLGNPPVFIIQFAPFHNYRIPGTYSQLLTELDDLNYTEHSERGIIVLNPLSINRDGQLFLPQKLVYGIAAENEDSAFQYDREFRHRFHHPITGPKSYVQR